MVDSFERAVRCELEGSHGDRPAVIDGHGHCGGYTTLWGSTVSQQFAEDLEAVTGVSLDVVQGTAVNGDVVLSLDSGLSHAAGGERFAEEGYFLEATTANLEITAPSSVGVFYGTRTALQGIMQSPGRASFPAGETMDWPDYESRGFSLDVGRRFFSAGFIRDYIKMMSWYKLNEFQIHLNDNEIWKPASGWKDAYAGFRLKSENPEFAGLASEDGSYDRSDWESFEQVAAAHSMLIIPEIDVPAHSLAFVKWDPELGLNSGIVDGVASIEDDHLDLTPANYDYTVETIKSVFDEFIPWFEGSDVHFGADEYSKVYADEYRDFFNDMAAHIRSHGKQPRAWGSMKWMHGSAEGYDRDVTLNAWSNDWYEMPAAVEDGYRFINTNDATLYVVPTANYYNGQTGLPNQQLYNTWLPNRLVSSAPVQPGQPAGAMFAVWNDLVDGDYDELDVHALVGDSFPVIAQKTWRAQPPTASYAEFSAVRDALAGGPGLAVINQGIGAAMPNEVSFGAEVSVTGADPDHPGSALVDGRPFTRWQQSSDDASFTIDLGAVRTVERVAVDWANPVPEEFEVQLSNDNVTWRTVSGTGGDDSEVWFDPRGARYVRVNATGDSGRIGAWAARVFGPAPISVGAVVTASGQETVNFPPELAVDGDLTTRWSANAVAEPWIQLDLDTPRTFEQIELAWEVASATAFRIETSDDGSTWTTLLTESGLAANARTDHLEFSPVTARYVRLTVTAKAMAPYLSLYEFTIPAMEASGPDPTAGPTVTVTATSTATATTTATATVTATATATTTATTTTTATQTTTATAPAPTVTVTSTAVPTTGPSSSGPIDVYTTPGHHWVNGRAWFTACSPYSSTTRCRTEIWATQARYVDGKFMQEKGWVFNNLTYLPSPRSIWADNPLGRETRWTAADGRAWYTECDTATTGRNGCRSYARADVVTATRQGSVWTYSTEKKWVLNNIVLFSGR